ncbi:MAG: hypothetical protein H6713_30765 [Myxococcales bacterium]|nr:hypothetical protein [Myxococcales bacterium]MCB9754347.1 hypothetical protein [Myxococcales bacterium]
MAKLLEYNATLIKRVDITPKLAIFRVKPDDGVPGEGAWFTPGQYMVIGLNNEKQPELGRVQRPMSIASEPEQRDFIDFYIRYVDHPESDNPLTHLLWDIQEGARMYARVRPTGKFTIKDTMGEDDPRVRIYLAAGTGLAPFLSIVESQYRNDPDVDLSNTVMIHGASYSADLGYRERMLELAEKTGMKYLPTVSRTHIDTGWKGASGRAEDWFKAERLGELERLIGLPEGGLHPGAAQVLICGLQGTIGMTVQRLLPRGFIPDNRKIRRALDIPEKLHPDVYYEAYDTTPPIDLDDAPLVASLKNDLAAGLAYRERMAAQSAS